MRLKQRLSSSVESLQSERLDVLLVCADGNYHTVGVRMIDMAICELGLKTRTIIPGLPSREILALLNQLRPRILGVSLSLSEQAQQIIQIANAVQNDSNFVGVTKILVGGSGIRNHEELFRGLPLVVVAPNDIVSLKKLVADEIRQKNHAA